MRTVTFSLAIFVLVLAGPAASLAATDSAPIGEFKPRQCQVDLETSRHVDCGTIRLPQVRSNPSLGSVRIPIAIVRAVNPRPDPILFVMGGPDYPGVDPFSTFYLGNRDFGSNRDWILFDARGIGSSEPRLSCPELDDADAAAFPDDPPGGIADLDALVAANRDCRQRLEREGVVPRAYASTDVAMDLRDLRLALGVDKWNVIALSAGGEAALQLVRLDPAGIRSVILDSPITRNYRPTFDFREYGYRLMNRAFRLCAAQADCAANYPNLRRRFLAEVDKLAAHPIDVELATSDGRHTTWSIDGVFLLEEGFYFASHPNTVADWPDVADYLARGHIEEYVSDIVLDPPEPFDEISARGRTMAARCRDDFNFQTVGVLAREQARFPRLAQRFARLHEIDMSVCAAWRVGKSSPSGHGYIDSSLPILTLQGEWDDGADDNGHVLGQARHFPNGWAYTFPSHGHIQFLDWPNSPGSCAAAIAAQFLAKPSVEPDASCIAEMPHVVFNVYDAPDAVRKPAAGRPLEWEFELRP